MERRDYGRKVLIEVEAANDPFKQFAKWFDEAKEEQVLDYHAFTLSTIGRNDFPHSRIVLLQNFDHSGFVFFTNYESNKGKEIGHCRNVCMNFFWPTVERQIRVYGIAKKISEEESDAYFHSRPRESQIGAWASQQSEVLTDRVELEKRYQDFENKFEDKEIPRPPHWGGYRIVPHLFEFWQGRPSRLHDRLIYKVDEDFNWYISRLSP